MTTGPDGMFRPEALQHQAQPVPAPPLLVLSGWATWTYLLFTGICLSALAFTATSFIPRYADGQFVVRNMDRTVITASATGVVSQVMVRAGQQIEKGQALVAFESAAETAELLSLERQFEAVLIRLLTNPLDDAARENVDLVRAARDRSSAALDQRVVRAPAQGVLGDVRVRLGQDVLPGDVLTSLSPVSDARKFAVTAVIPGRHRPFISPGLPLRLRIGTQRVSEVTVTVGGVDNEVRGTLEIARALGIEPADLHGAADEAVLVHAILPSSSFSSEGRNYSYFDGLRGTARLELQRERLLFTLAPWLRDLWGREE